MEWRRLNKSETALARRLYNRYDNELSPRMRDCPGGISGVIEILFDKGGILIPENFMGIAGYCFGEPSKNFENKEIGYLYNFVIDAKYRNNLFRGFLRTFLSEMSQNNVSEIRFKGEIGSPVNKLWVKITDPIGVEKNAAGTWSVIYSADLESGRRFMR